MFDTINHKQAQVEKREKRPTEQSSEATEIIACPPCLCVGLWAARSLAPLDRPARRRSSACSACASVAGTAFQRQPDGASATGGWRPECDSAKTPFSQTCLSNCNWNICISSTKSKWFCAHKIPFVQHSTTINLFVFGRNIYVRSKFSCVRSSHDLCAHAHAHSLEGRTLVVTQHLFNWMTDISCTWQAFTSALS